MRFRSAFFAYPSGPSDLVTTIARGLTTFQLAPGKVALTAWPQMDVFGASIPDEVRDKINDCDVLVCDVTRPNLNVYYEAGYAIGRGKAIAPVLNASFANAVLDLQQTGMFDNIGYQQYENSDQLAEILARLPTTKLLELYSKPVNFRQPLYLLDAFRKTDFRNSIVAGIKESKVFYRSFDPAEVPRFTAVSTISEVTASAGVIVPILGTHVDDSARHNLRGAFLAGLSYGLGRQTLLLQLYGATNPIPVSSNPADYREDIVSARNEAEVRGAVIPFAQASLVYSQSISTENVAEERSPLQRLTLGASAAENEFRTLGAYFVETSEFIKTLRGEVNVVTGRKGSGKTAIFFRVRDSFRQTRTDFITDLKPESHQLSLFREELDKVVGIGVFDHTIAAFWYFVILSEILLTLKRDFDARGRVDNRALRHATEIEESMRQFSIDATGDFTSRINRLGSLIAQEIVRLKSKDEVLSPERLTNLVFAGGIAQIRDQILRHAPVDSKLIVLFDNIDKGWPANGIHPHDVRIVRLLIEAMDKIRRDFTAQGREFMSVIFLRNDIYELLIEDTPDRGKAGELRIDWTDRAKLRQVIYKRLQMSAPDKTQNFQSLWSQSFAETVEGRDSFEYFVDHSLMRPRFLINIVENAVAHAINRGHERVEAADCLDAVTQHSHYLVNDFGYEIRDVSGLPAEILYSLVGVTQLLTRSEALDRFRGFGIAEKDLDAAFELMLWYGAIGIARQDGNRFIYDYEYNLKRLAAELRNAKEEPLYVVNSALHVGLK